MKAVFRAHHPLGPTSLSLSANVLSSASQVPFFWSGFDSFFELKHFGTQISVFVTHTRLCKTYDPPPSPPPSFPPFFQVAKKMRAKSEENAALKVRVAETERARDRADAEAFRLRDNLDRLTEQRDNLLLGATRAGHASSPADALAELLAAAAAGVATGAGTGTRASTANTNLGRDRGIDGINRGLRLGGAWGELFPGEGGHGGGNDGNGGGARRQGDREGGGGESGSAGGALEVSAEELERARAEAKLAKVAVQQERLKRDGAMREKDEAVRQLHRLMGAARRAVGKRDNKLRSSRLETEVVWNALTEAVREE